MDPPPRHPRGSLQFHLDVGDLDVIDGLVDVDELGHYPAPPVAQNNAFLALPGNFAARIGLNETSLTKAISAGDFAHAEDIISGSLDPEFLNDGAHTATPLALVLTGRSAFCGMPRNLYLAKLLVEKGANVNLRIPNHDLETASESPMELLINFYLALLKNFQEEEKAEVMSMTMAM